jgi:hypothetical protein
MLEWVTFPPEMAARHPPEVVVQQRDQAVERRGVSPQDKRSSVTWCACKGSGISS